MIYTVYYTCQLLAVVPNSPQKTAATMVDVDQRSLYFHGLALAQVPDEGTEKGGVQSRCPTRALGG